MADGVRTVPPVSGRERQTEGAACASVVKYASSSESTALLSIHQSVNGSCRLAVYTLLINRHTHHTSWRRPKPIPRPKSPYHGSTRTYDLIDFELVVSSCWLYHIYVRHDLAKWSSGGITARDDNAHKASLRAAIGICQISLVLAGRCESIHVSVKLSVS